MKYTALIDNITSLDWGLNLQQAYVFCWVYSLPSWADSIIFENKIYYFACRSKFIQDMPLLSDKIDTVYRYIKELDKLGLIESIKVNHKDYIALTDKAKKWNTKSENSEKNPRELGKFSENNSENNPTYYIISNDNNINDKKNTGLDKQAHLQTTDLKTKQSYSNSFTDSPTAKIPAENPKKGMHLFINSPYFDYPKFADSIGQDYQQYDLKYYHKCVTNWSASKGAMKKDWLATARNFILRDVRDNKPKLAKNKPNSFNKVEDLFNAK